jgi:hypothetical protein
MDGKTMENPGKSLKMVKLWRPFVCLKASKMQWMATWSKCWRFYWPKKQ